MYQFINSRKKPRTHSHALKLLRCSEAVLLTSSLRLISDGCNGCIQSPGFASLTNSCRKPLTNPEKSLLLLSSRTSLDKADTWGSQRVTACIIQRLSVLFRTWRCMAVQALHLQCFKIMCRQTVLAVSQQFNTPWYVLSGWTRTATTKGCCGFDLWICVMTS